MVIPSTMAIAMRTMILLVIFVSAVAPSLTAPPGDLETEGMVIEDISEIMRSEERYAPCPPQKILIGTRCRQIFSEEELRKIGLLEEYTDCVRKNVEDLDRDGRNDSRTAVDSVRIHHYCMTMCMLRAERL